MKIFRHIYIYLTLILSILCVSCSTQELSEWTGLGWVSYTLTIDENPLAPSNGNFSLKMSTIDNTFSHTWESLDDIPEYESYHIGEYYACVMDGDIDAEGYDCQAYYGESTFQITESKQTYVNITASMYQSIIDCHYEDDFLARFPGGRLLLHTPQHGYIVDTEVNKPIFMSPGETWIELILKDEEENELIIYPNIKFLTESGTRYDISLDYIDDKIVFIIGDEFTYYEVSDEIFKAKAPTVKPLGFESDEPIFLVEGFPSNVMLAMQIESTTPIKALNLSATGLSQSMQLPTECNLLSDAIKYEEYGLKVNKTSENSYLVNFTNFLEEIKVDDEAEIKFILQAIDIYGRASEVNIMHVYIKGVHFLIMDQTEAVIGDNIATITLALNQDKVEISDFKIFSLNPQMQMDKELEITSWAFDDAKRIMEISFRIEPGINSVPIEVYYLDIPKAQTIINRKVPNFDFESDAFAKNIHLKIKVANEALTSSITRFCTIYADNKEAYVTLRDPENGEIVIGGLDPERKYLIRAYVIAGQYVASKYITTEAAEQIVDSDFEDADVLYKYDHLPSGGPYSTSQFPIYNMQNYEDVRITWLRKGWACVNEKTFCMKAENPNTWYMQASSQTDNTSFVSGNKSVKLTSVGWSLDGEEILPYLQTKDQFLPYNNNVPMIAHKSAGKLFLGSYEFNAATLSERYKEGIKFTSRPASLNGFYKFTPDKGSHNDAGLVEIELLNVAANDTVTVASATALLYTSPDFVAFNVPLTYNVLGLRPNMLKILFSSSRHIGTIEEEDLNVPVTAYPSEGKYIGSTLWIDNISFSY